MKLRQDFNINDHEVTQTSRHGASASRRSCIPRQGRSLTLLEIGVGTGSTRQMWQGFAPMTTVVGIDTDADRMTTNKQDTHIHISIRDPSGAAFLNPLEDEFGPFVLVLDEGSHPRGHILTIFKHPHPRLPKKGTPDGRRSPLRLRAGGRRRVTGGQPASRG